MDGQSGGQRDIASHFDLSWTSARVACDWYLVEGANPLYLPEGFDASTNYPVDVPKTIDVSFVGAAYGFRRQIVDHLRSHHINVATYGRGWQASIGQDEMRSLYNRSVINLGVGDIGYASDLTNVKGRDFEVTGTGGGAYLTTYNSDLCHHFTVGAEILCYRGLDELIELIRYYLAHRDETTDIAHAARARALREHRWLHRYIKVLTVLGVLRKEQAGHGV